MRIVQFYSGVESFNYFTNRIDRELKKLGHETFILDLRNIDGRYKAPDAGATLAEFTTFCSKTVDIAISYDGFGIKEDMFTDLWDSMDTMAVNILMDHPLRFHDTMRHHPHHYVQFCCDQNHVDYVRKYFSHEVPQVFFLPHAGTVPEEIEDATDISRIDRQKVAAEFGDNKKDIDILFSGTYYDPNRYYEDIDKWFDPGTVLNQFYKDLFLYMRDNPKESPEQAVSSFIYLKDMNVDQEKMLIMMRAAEPVDWMVRHYFRQQVVSTLVNAGFNVSVLGRGWENHPDAGKSNLIKLDDRIPFADTFSYMHRAKLNLNVMPFFKAGSHDRIFNAYLEGSVPLTDPSEFLLEKYEAFIKMSDSGTGELPIYYLDRLNELPELAGLLLQNDELRSKLYRRGFEKTRYSFIWKNLVDEVLEKAQMYR